MSLHKIILTVALLSTPFISPAVTPLTLNQCRQLARENNSSIKIARSNIEVAEQQQKSAFTNYFPQVSAIGMAFNANKNMVELNTNQILSEIPTDLSAMLPPGLIPPSFGFMKNGVIGAITATQPVFAGGQIINGNRLARLGVETGHIKLDNTLDEVDLATEQYFWQIISLNEKLLTLATIDSMLASLEKDVSVAVKAGIAMPNDLLQVHLKVGDIASSRIKIENSLDICHRLLAQHIGMDGSHISLVADSVTMPDFPLNLRCDHSTALLSTTGYRLMQKNVEANELQQKITVGKNLPTVGVGASYSYNDLMGKGNHSGMLFVSVNVPISGWWGGSHSIKQQNINTSIAREQLESNSQLLIIAMDNAWNDVEDAYRQMQLAEESINQAIENLRLERDYYQAGIATMSDLLEAQQQYRLVRDRFTDAYIEFQLSIIKYRQATGQQV